MTTTTTPALLSDAESIRLGREYQQLKAAKVSAEKRMKEIEGRWRDALDFGSHAAGPCKVGIVHNVTRDDARFAELYPFEANPDFYKAVPDSDAIKDQLSPSQVRAFQKEGAAKVVVTFFEA